MCVCIRPGKDLAQLGKDQAEIWHSSDKTRLRSGTILGKAQAEIWHNSEKIKRSLAHPWHGFRKKQRRSRSTNKGPKRKRGAHRKRPGGDLAQLGKDQADIWHNSDKIKQSSGTIWLRPGKDLAQFGKAQAETWHNMAKLRRRPGKIWKRPNEVWHNNGNEPFGLKNKTVT